MSIKKIDKNNYAFSTNINHQLIPKISIVCEPVMHINDFQSFKKSLSNKEAVSNSMQDKLNTPQLHTIKSDKVFARINSENSQSQSGNLQIRHITHSNITNNSLVIMDQNLSSQQSAADQYKKVLSLLKGTNHLLQKQLKSAFNFLKNTVLINNPLIKNSNSNTSYLLTTKQSQNNRLRKQPQAQSQLVIKGNILQAVHKINGWIQYKILIIVSTSFKDICQFYKQKITQSIFFQPPPKNQITLSDFSLSEYGHQSQSALIQQKHIKASNFNESLVYTLDCNFEFTPKQQAQILPQKTSNQQKQIIRSLKIQNHTDNYQSGVQLFKPFHNVKQSSQSKKQQQKVKYHQTTLKSPINKSSFKSKQCLLALTNVYQSPMLSNIQFTRSNRFSPKMTAKIDLVFRNTPECNEDCAEQLIQDIQRVNFLFKQAQNSYDNKNRSSFINGLNNKRPAIIKMQQSQVNRYNIDEGLHINRTKQASIIFNSIQKHNSSPRKINFHVYSPKYQHPSTYVKIDRKSANKQYYALPQLLLTDVIKKELQNYHIQPSHQEQAHKKNNFQYKCQNISQQNKNQQKYRKQTINNNYHLYTPNQFSKNSIEQKAVINHPHLHSPSKNIQRQKQSIQMQHLAIKRLNQSPTAKKIHSYKSLQILQSNSPLHQLQFKKQLLPQTQKQLPKLPVKDTIDFDNNYYSTTANSTQQLVLPKTTPLHSYEKLQSPKKLQTVNKPVIIPNKPIERMNSYICYSPPEGVKQKSQSLSTEHKPQSRRGSKCKLTVTLNKNK